MNSDRAAQPSAALLAIVIGLIAVVWFAPLGIRDLFGTDEGRYAEIPREMVATGDWITPRLNDIKYFEKPPLQYWVTAVAYEAFGEHDWSSRLWAALTGFAGVLLTGLTGRALYGARAGLLAAAVQSSALLYVLLGQINTLDMGLCFCLQLTLSALAVLARASCTAGERRWWPLVLAVGVALALLSKGLIGILIPGAAACLYALLYRDWRFILRLRPWRAAIIVLGVAGPWFLTVSRRNPEFAQFFFIHEHLERFLTREHHRYQPWWFFIPVLIIGLSPWISFAPRSIANGLRRSRAGDSSAGLLLIWIAFVFLFFSASQSKLMPYILPLFPAVAILMGRTIGELAESMVRRHFQYTAVFLVFAATLLPFVARLPLLAGLLHSPARLSYVGLLTIAVASGAVASVGAAILARSHRPWSAVLAMSLGGLALAQIGSAGQQVLSAERSTADVAANVRPALREGTRIYCVEDYEQTLTFYLQRSCILAAYRGELDFGLRQEPWHGIDTVAEFRSRWYQETDAVAILQPDRYRHFTEEGVPMRLIYRGIGKVAVARR